MERDVTVVVLDRATGEVQGELVNLEPDEVSWVRNGYGEMIWTIPTSHPAFDLVWGRELKSEVQLWRYGDVDPLWWGVIVDSQASEQAGGDVRFLAIEVPWYLEPRYIGRAGRVNYAKNGSMESPFSADVYNNWVAVGVTMARGGEHKFDGAWGMTLEQTTPKVDTYAHQLIGLPAGDQVLTVVAHFHIHNDTPWPFEEALNGYGVRADLIKPGNVYSHKAGYGISPRFGHKKGDSGRAEFTISTGPTWTGGHMDLRLYAPQGRITYDGVQVVLMESLSLPQTDQTTILQEILEHAQDPAMGKRDAGVPGSDIRLGWDPTNAPSGVRRDFVAQFADHVNVLDAMQDLAVPADGVDWRFRYTKTERLLETIFPRGVLQAQYPLVYHDDSPGNTARFTYERRGRQVRTSVLALGDGEGPDRREGWAKDTTDYEGLILEELADFSESTIGSDLTALAQGALNAKKYVVKVISAETQLPLLGNVKPSDAVPVRIKTKDGINFLKDLVINEMRYRPASKTMSLVFNDA